LGRTGKKNVGYRRGLRGNREGAPRERGGRMKEKGETGGGD